MYSFNKRQTLIRKAAFATLPLMLVIVVAMLAPGCSRESAMPTALDNPAVVAAEPGTGAFTIEPKSASIRSYQGGGGVFIVRLVPGEGLVGDVHLSVSADPKLNAVLTRSMLNSETPVAEIAIEPTRSVDLIVHTITLTATNATTEQIVNLQVDVQHMWQGNVGTTAEPNQIRDIFIEWLENEHPELGSLSNRDWFQYMTYGQMLEVEHWTYLDSEWEIRIALHQTWPPDDWYKMRLRHREGWEATIALFRESDGTIYEFPVSEYPVLYGY